MENFWFTLYALGVLSLFCVVWFLEVVMVWMQWLLEHWEIITLVVTNIGALFVNPPRRKK